VVPELDFALRVKGFGVSDGRGFGKWQDRLNHLLTIR